VSSLCSRMGALLGPNLWELSSDPTNRTILSRPVGYRILYHIINSRDRSVPDYYTRNHPPTCACRCATGPISRGHLLICCREIPQWRDQGKRGGKREGGRGRERDGVRAPSCRVFCVSARAARGGEARSRETRAPYATRSSMIAAADEGCCVISSVVHDRRGGQCTQTSRDCSRFLC
jgi:hypothetical protein